MKLFLEAYQLRSNLSKRRRRYKRCSNQQLPLETARRIRRRRTKRRRLNRLSNNKSSSNLQLRRPRRL